MNAPTHTPGDVGLPFWEGLKQRKLLLQFDAASGRAQFYPRPQSLFSEAGVVWREASGRGRIAALTTSRVAPPHLATAAPYLLALVRLEEGPRLLARVAAHLGSLAIGQPVAIDWSAVAEAPPFPIFKPA